MESINLEPEYSNNEIPGKCIKCLAEKELNDCLRELLRDERDDKKLQDKYEMIVNFLQSPESEKLRIESERLLAEGKKVILRLSQVNGVPEYKLEVE